MESSFKNTWFLYLIHPPDALHVQNLLELGGVYVRHEFDVLLDERLQGIVVGHDYLQRHLCACHA